MAGRQIQENLGDVQMSPELARLLNLSDKAAQQSGDKFITSEMVLLAGGTCTSAAMMFVFSVYVVDVWLLSVLVV